MFTSGVAIFIAITGALIALGAGLTFVNVRNTKEHKEKGD